MPGAPEEEYEHGTPGASKEADKRGTPGTFEEEAAPKENASEAALK